MTFLKQNWFKIWAICLLLLVGFYFVETSWATSGACSSHNGVNCSVKDYYGYAVCNDGFVSSVPYYDMVKCACVYPSKYGYSCTTDIDYELLEMGLTDEYEKAEETAYNHIGGVVFKTELDDLAYMKHRHNLLLIQCRGEIWEYQQAVKEYDMCRDTRNSISTLPEPTPTSRSCPANSYDNGDKCTCISGYIANFSRDGCILAPTPIPTPRPTPPSTPIFTPVTTFILTPIPKPFHTYIPTITPTSIKITTPTPIGENKQQNEIVVKTATESYSGTTKKDNVIIKFFKFFFGLFK